MIPTSGINKQENGEYAADRIDNGYSVGNSSLRVSPFHGNSQLSVTFFGKIHLHGQLTQFAVELFLLFLSIFVLPEVFTSKSSGRRLSISVFHLPTMTGWISYSLAISLRVLTPLIASRATRALNSAECFLLSFFIIPHFFLVEELYTILQLNSWS